VDDVIGGMYCNDYIVYGHNISSWRVSLMVKEKLSIHEYNSGADPGGRPSPPPKIGKNMIFFAIFHTKYPQNFRTSLRSAQFFLSASPLTLNPGSATAIVWLLY
jgi:hypothetical protein